MIILDKIPHLKHRPKCETNTSSHSRYIKGIALKFLIDNYTYIYRVRDYNQNSNKIYSFLK